MQIPDTAVPGPEKRLEVRAQHPAADIPAEIGEAGHRARIVDRHGSVPTPPAQRRQLHGAAVLPQQCVPGTEGTDRIAAVAGDTNDLTGVVDGGRSEEHTSELQSHVNLVCRL